MDETSHSQRRRGYLIAAIIAYLVGLAWLSLARGGMWACSGEWLVEQGSASRGDLLVNVLAYVPLGAMLAVGSGYRLTRLLPAILLGALFSLTIETLQSCMPGRVSSWTDLLTNTLGTAIGAFLPAIAGRVSSGLGAGRVPGLASGMIVAEPLRSLALLTILAWVLGRTFPWILTVDVGQMRSNLSFLGALVGGDVVFDGWRLLRHVAAWLVLGLSVRALLNPWAPVMRTTLVVFAAVLLLQLLLIEPSGSLEELLGLLLAAPVLVAFRFPAASVWLPHALAIAAFVMVGAYEMQPGSNGASTSFGWLPAFGLGGQVGALQLAIFFFGFAFACATAAVWRGAGDSHRHHHRDAQGRSRSGSQRSRGRSLAVEANASGQASADVALAGSTITASTALDGRDAVPVPAEHRSSSTSSRRSGSSGRSGGRRRRGRRRNHIAKAFVASIAWLVLLEVIQVIIPGRLADPSPPLLAAVAWAIAMTVKHHMEQPASGLTPA